MNHKRSLKIFAILKGLLMVLTILVGCLTAWLDYLVYGKHHWDLLGTALNLTYFLFFLVLVDGLWRFGMFIRSINHKYIHQDQSQNQDYE